MPSIELQISEETHRRLLILKNHWSFTYRKVTNDDVIEKLNSLKKEIFGYGPDAFSEDIQKISIKKTKNELVEEAERFQRGFKILLESGLDFEPEYTMDMHLKKMVELIENNDEIGAPLF